MRPIRVGNGSVPARALEHYGRGLLFSRGASPSAGAQSNSCPLHHEHWSLGAVFFLVGFLLAVRGLKAGAFGTTGCAGQALGEPSPGDVCVRPPATHVSMTDASCGEPARRLPYPYPLDLPCIIQYAPCEYQTTNLEPCNDAPFLWRSLHAHELVVWCKHPHEEPVAKLWLLRGFQRRTRR